MCITAHQKVDCLEFSRANMPVSPEPELVPRAQIAAPAFAMSGTARSNPPPLPTKKQQQKKSNEQALKARALMPSARLPSPTLLRASAQSLDKTEVGS